MDNDSERKPSLWRRITASKYLRRESPPNSVREIIHWWELRRVPFNLAVGIAGLMTFVVWLSSLVVLILVKPEIAQDPEAPMIPDNGLFAIAGVILYAIAANVCYTGGWIFEVALFWFGRKGDQYFGPVSFALGTLLSFALTLLPALAMLVYAIYRIFAPAG